MTEYQTNPAFQPERSNASVSSLLWQISELVKRVYGLETVVLPDGHSFRSKDLDSEREGVRSVVGRVQDGPVLTLRIECLEVTGVFRPSLDTFWKRVSGLSDGVRPLPPTSNTATRTASYWLGLSISAATPLGLSREAVLTAEFEAIDEFARWLQSEVPQRRDFSELQKAYADHAQTLAPVFPLEADDSEPLAALDTWAGEVTDLLDSSLNVAVAADSSVELDAAIAALARHAHRRGESIGSVLVPALGAKNIVELAGLAPGRVVVPASRVALATSPYELGDQLQNLLTILSSSRKPVVFTGSYQQLQAVFHGGQGGVSDPLSPVVTHAPSVPIEFLTTFAVDAAARREGSMSSAQIASTAESIRESLRALPTSERLRLLPVIAARQLRLAASGSNDDPEATQSFVAHLANRRETLAGMHARPRAHRNSKVHENLSRGLLDSDLLAYLSSHLFAQDKALSALVARLQTECLTRADHQPIRYCAQGTPGTGKSESAALLARYLNIPHINIDAASQPDYHTASAQLLGSGRGIVGSYEAGRLEKAAKHSVGAVVEVSDLDHAPTAVRSHLADLFLQVLDTGEAQSATGAMFSCANLIFAFTINLPEGRDERLLRGIGFNGVPSQLALQQGVETEIKMLFSNAFLSRIGRPILFAPLSGAELAIIAERELHSSLLRGLHVLGVVAPAVEIVPGTGIEVVQSLGTGLISHGARVVAEQARQLVTRALLEHRAELTALNGATLQVRFDSDSKITLTPHP